MTNLLNPGSDQLSLNSQHVALILARQAATESAIIRKSEAFKTVVAEVQTSKEEAKRYREKARYLELDVTRTDAWLAKTRYSLTQEQAKSAKLQLQLEEGGTVCQKCRRKENGVTSLIHIGHPVEQGRPFPHPKEEPTETHPQSIQGNFQKRAIESRQALATKGDAKLNIGISFEQHELLIREAARLKDELTQLASQRGQDVDKILDAADLKEIIKKLQRDIQDKSDDNEMLLERIQQLCSKDDGPASQHVELLFKNEKLEKRLRVSQMMIDTLSKRCEELKDEVEMSGHRQPSEETKDLPDTKASELVKSKEANTVQEGSLPQGDDSVDGDLSRRHSEQQMQRLEKEVQLLDTQLKDVMANNKQLYRERHEAEKQREIYEERYNKLMETLQDVQQQQRQCSNCRSLELELAKLRCEVIDLKDINELVRAQMKLNEEDLRQEQQESASLKHKNDFHIEQWKKNCQRMGQQVDLLMSDLKKERDENKRLKALLRSNKASPVGRNAISMAPTFNNLQTRCSPMSGPECPAWQNDIECDGPGGRDEYDGPTLKPALTGDNTMHSSQPLQSGPLTDKKPLECPCCKRDFPADRMEDFQVHVNKCMEPMPAPTGDTGRRGSPLHLRSGSPPHLRSGSPPHLRSGSPPHLRSGFRPDQKPLECPCCKRDFPADRMEDFQVHVNKCIDNS